MKDNAAGWTITKLRCRFVNARYLLGTIRCPNGGNRRFHPLCLQQVTAGILKGFSNTADTCVATVLFNLPQQDFLGSLAHPSTEWAFYVKLACRAVTASRSGRGLARYSE